MLDGLPESFRLLCSVLHHGQLTIDTIFRGEPSISQRPPKRSTMGPSKGASAAPMRISPDRKRENYLRETPQSSVNCLRNTLKVLDK
jgi:hypothetical protein